MPRQRDPRRDEAFIQWKESNGAKLLKDIANDLDCQPSQIRKWKSQDKWEEKLKGNVTNSKRSVTNRVGAPKGNKNAVGNRGGSAPRGNSNAVTHGFFRTIFPDDDETHSIIESIDIKSPIDMLWENIVIQYTAIARAQKVMFVKDQDDTTRILKRTKPGMYGDEKEYEIQFAWDKQATFLNAQARAISNLQSLIKQYEEMLRIEGKDERDALELQKLKAQINVMEQETKSEGEGQEAWIAAIHAVAEKRRKKNEGESG